MQREYRKDCVNVKLTYIGSYKRSQQTEVKEEHRIKTGHHMIASSNTKYLSTVDTQTTGFFSVPLKVCLYQDEMDFPEAAWNAAGEHLDVSSLKHTHHITTTHSEQTSPRNSFSVSLSLV